jgi:S1-C subfamily serine protease
MSTPERPAQPSRWIRTLPWLAGLLLGTAAHLVWWTSTRNPAEPAVQVVTVAVPSPDVHVHVHQARDRGVAVTHATAGSCRSARRSPPPRTLDGARGAVVCSGHGCTIRRSFVDRLLRDPSLLGHHARVHGVRGPAGPEGLRILGVFPGSVPDLLGLRNGDVIAEIDGVPMRSPSDLLPLAGSVAKHDGVAVTLRRGGLRQTLRYRVIDG